MEQNFGTEMAEPLSDHEDADAAASADAAPKKRVGVASTLPVVLPSAQKRRTTLLVQIDSDKLDLEGVCAFVGCFPGGSRHRCAIAAGDVGAIGRLSSTKNSVVLDLKGASPKTLVCAYLTSTSLPLCGTQATNTQVPTCLVTLSWW